MKYISLLSELWRDTSLQNLPQEASCRGKRCTTWAIAISKASEIHCCVGVMLKVFRPSSVTYNCFPQHQRNLSLLFVCECSQKF